MEHMSFVEHLRRYSLDRNDQLLQRMSTQIAAIGQCASGLIESTISCIRRRAPSSLPSDRRRPLANSLRRRRHRAPLLHSFVDC